MEQIVENLIESFDFVSTESESSPKNPGTLSEVVNSIGCIYRRRGMNREALSLLQNGLKMERKLGLNSGTTALNLSSVCFNLKKPKKSLSYAQLAISENMLKLKNVSDLLEDDQTISYGKLLCLSFMACSKALRTLGFPKKAVKQLLNANGIMEKLRVDSDDLLKRTIQVQLENANKEEMASEKFDVRSLSIDTKRSSNGNIVNRCLNRTASSNFYRSADRTGRGNYDSS